MFGHSNDSCISPPMKVMKFYSPGGVRIIRCNDFNHLNECTIISIKFGAIMPQKSNAALIETVFHDVPAHCRLFPSLGADLLPANTKHHIQLHLLTRLSVLNAAMAMIISINANDGNIITWRLDQFSDSGDCHSRKNTWNERSFYTFMHFVLPGSV